MTLKQADDEFNSLEQQQVSGESIETLENVKALESKIKETELENNELANSMTKMQMDNAAAEDAHLPPLTFHVLRYVAVLTPHVLRCVAVQAEAARTDAEAARAQAVHSAAEIAALHGQLAAVRSCRDPKSIGPRS